MEVLSVTGEVRPRDSGLDAALTGGWSLSVDALDASLLRIAVLPQEGPAVDRTWMIAPDGDAPSEGRAKLSRDGFPGASIVALGGDGEFLCGDVRVRLSGEPLRLGIDARGRGGDWRTLLADHETGGYVIADDGRTTRHCRALRETDRHFGLGKADGPLNRSGSRFQISQGNAATRQEPVVIVQDSRSGAAVGLLYDTTAEMAFGLGGEPSDDDGTRCHAEAQERGLVCYVIVGADLPAVVARLTELTGRPGFPPRRALGFDPAAEPSADTGDSDRRSFAITRAGSGDPAGWETLKRDLRNGLSLSLSGRPLVGQELGGTAQEEPELLLRRIQAMALQPFCALNSGGSEVSAEAVSRGHDEVEEDIGTALGLRHTFLPYLYTLAYRAHATGEPIIRPLFYASNAPEAYADHDAFLLGDHVLVAPVISKGETLKKIWLPDVPGGWLDFWSDQAHAGGQEVTLEAPPGRLPLLIRGGAVLPLALRYDARNPHEATETVIAAFPGTGSGTGAPAHAFFDDGESWNFRENQASLMDMKVSWEPDSVLLEGEERMTGAFRPEWKIMMVDAMARAGSVSGHFGMVTVVWERQFPLNPPEGWGESSPEGD